MSRKRVEKLLKYWDIRFFYPHTALESYLNMEMDSLIVSSIRYLEKSLMKLQNPVMPIVSHLNVKKGIGRISRSLDNLLNGIDTVMIPAHFDAHDDKDKMALATIIDDCMKENDTIVSSFLNKEFHFPKSKL